MEIRRLRPVEMALDRQCRYFLEVCLTVKPYSDQMLIKLLGSATSPDALYIYDSIAAANEILHISLRLAQMGSLRYLPSRYLINISYAVFCLKKKSYSGAVEEKDMHR